MLGRDAFEQSPRLKANMKRQIEVGQTFRRGGARGKLWRVEEILIWPQGTHVRMNRVDDPTTKHLVATDALDDNGYEVVEPASL